MSVILSAFAGAGAQFFDNNGNVLTGGKIYSYAAGTTTPLETYTSASGVTLHTNPIILNAAGRVPGGEIWILENVNYKFVLKDSSDVLIATYDNIDSLYVGTDLANTTNPALGDALVGFRQSNAAGNLVGAIGRTVHQKLQESVSVKDFGAVGDGVTDDSPAIQAAFTSCSENETTLYVPNGTYRLASQIRIVSTTARVSPQVNLIGEDVTKTIFTVNGTENSDGAFLVSKPGPLFNVTIENIQIKAISNTGNCGTAISLSELQGGGAQLRSIYLNNIYITTEDTLVSQTGGINNIPYPAYWTTGVSIVRSPRPGLVDVIVENPKQNTNDNLIRYADSSVNYLATYGFSIVDCYGPNIVFCKAYQCSTGFLLDNATETTGAAVEGGNFLNCVAVNVKTGIKVDADLTSGIEPGLNIDGTHINYRDYGVYVYKRKIITIQNVVFYHPNSEAGTVGIANPTDIYILTGFSVLVTNNFFSFDAGVDRLGVVVVNWDVAGNTIPRVVIANNFFDATFLFAIRTYHDSDIGPEVGLNFFGPNVVNQINNNGKLKYAPSAPGLTSYFYTPTITNTTNIAASTAFRTMYSQNGSVVTVSGRIGIDPTALGTTCIFDMDVPIPATLTDEYDAAGALNGVLASTAVSSGGVIFANGAGKVTAQIVPVNINLNAYYFTYQYSIY